MSFVFFKNYNIALKQAISGLYRTWRPRSLMLFMILSFNLLGHAWSASHHPQAFLDTLATSQHQGEAIVKHFCATCHAAKPDIQLGAPRMNERADWEIRLKQGLNVLFAHTNEGYGAMPARGGCFECSDEQLMLAIRAMLPNIEH